MSPSRARTFHQKGRAPASSSPRPYSGFHAGTLLRAGGLLDSSHSGRRQRRLPTPSATAPRGAGPIKADRFERADSEPDEECGGVGGLEVQKWRQHETREIRHAGRLGGSVAVSRLVRGVFRRPATIRDEHGRARARRGRFARRIAGRPRPTRVPCPTTQRAPPRANAPRTRPRASPTCDFRGCSTSGSGPRPRIARTLVWATRAAAIAGLESRAASPRVRCRPAVTRANGARRRRA
jgi:hypothetical protein